MRTEMRSHRIFRLWKYLFCGEFLVHNGTDTGVGPDVNRRTLGEKCRIRDHFAENDPCRFGLYQMVIKSLQAAFTKKRLVFSTDQQ